MRYPASNTKSLEILSKLCVNEQEYHKDLQELLIYQLLSKYGCLHEMTELFIKKLVIYQGANVESWITDMGNLILARNEVKYLQSLVYAHQLSVLYTLEFGLVYPPARPWFSSNNKLITTHLKSLINSCDSSISKENIQNFPLFTDFDAKSIYVPALSSDYPFHRSNLVELYICTIKFFIAFTKARPEFWLVYCYSLNAIYIE